MPGHDSPPGTNRPTEEVSEPATPAVGADPPEALTLPPSAPASEARTLAPGDDGPSVPAVVRVQVPGYELLSVLGQGGMGVVYKARQVELGRVVALKMILHAEHAGTAQRERFLVEAQAVARLQHPNIVQIYEIGEHDGLPYFSLEYCGGGCLADWLDGTPWPAPRAAQLVETLARAMHTAHQAQVVHRDLKPANVLLTEEGEPKITDFGLAKKLDEQVRTQTGAILGTPSYMAPEQAGGKSQEIGPAADVYALGAILYELLTGRPPFVAATPLDTVLQVVSEEPVLVRQLQPRTPRDLETICLKCLQKQPGARYASALRLAEDLRRFQAGEPIEARAVGKLERGWRWCRRNPAVASLLFAVAVVLIAGTAVSTFFAVQSSRRASDAEASAERAREAEQKAERNAARAGERLYAAQMLLAHKAWEDGHFFRLRSLLQEKPPEPTGGATVRGFEWEYWNRLADPALVTFARHGSVVNSLAFRPDGKHLASASWDRTVKVWDPTTGQEFLHLAGHDGEARCVAYSPDGKRLVSGGGREVRVWDTATGQPLHVLAGHTEPVWCVAWSPDGRHIASGGIDRTVRVWDAQTGRPAHILAGHTGVVASLAFAPDGRLFSGSHDHTVRGWDVDTGKQTLHLGTGIVVSAVAVSPDGRRLAWGGGGSAVTLWDIPHNERVISLQGHSSGVNGISFSPDGQRLASAATDWTVRVWDLTTGRQAFALGTTTVCARCAVFSPDGRRLAGSDDRVAKVWDVTTSPEVLTWPVHAGGVTDLAFSPDGLRLVSGGGDGTIKVSDALDGRVLSAVGGFGQGVSRATFLAGDEHLAVACRDGTGAVVDAATGNRIRILKGGGVAAFSPDGGRLACLGWDNILRVQDTATGNERFAIPIPPGGFPSALPRALALGSGGKLLAGGGDEATVTVWDVETGRLRHFLSGRDLAQYVLNYAVFCLAVSSDGKYLAEGTYGGEVLVWDLGTKQKIHSLKGHNAQVAALAFSPDGTRLASGGSDQTVKMWDVGSGQEVLSVRGPGGAITCLAFSPNGDCLAAGGADGTVQVRTTMPADGGRLNQMSWEVVRQPGREAEQYLRALRWAEAASRVAPDSGMVLNTLGVAQYRTGRYARAVGTLERAADLNKGTPADLAFLAMAHHRLGQLEPARTRLAVLRETLRQPRWEKDEEARSFLREAEDLMRAAPP